MELGVSPSLRTGLASRAAPIAGGCAVLALGAFVATHDPGAAGSAFPPCAFHQLTGLWCPGCGLTRGTYQLLHGHVGAALSYNIFTPVAMVAIIAGWLCWLRYSWGAPPIRLPRQAARWLALATPTLLFAYGVLRNIPAAPFRALAP